MAMAGAERRGEAGLLVVLRGEVHVPPLGGDRHPGVPDPRQESHPETSAGGQENAVARRLGRQGRAGRPGLEDGEVPGAAEGDRLRRRHEIVDEADPALWNPRLAGEGRGVELRPVEVGEPRTAIPGDRSRYPEGGGAHRRTVGAQEGGEDGRETGEVGARVGLRTEEPRADGASPRVSAGSKEAEVGLGPPDVAGEEKDRRFRGAQARSAWRSAATPAAASFPRSTVSTLRPRCSSAFRSPAAWALMSLPKV